MFRKLLPFLASALASKAGVKAELPAIPGGAYGNFTTEERTKSYLEIHELSGKNGLGGV